MKKILALLLSAAILCSLAACGTEERPTLSDGSSGTWESAEETPMPTESPEPVVEEAEAPSPADTQAEALTEEGLRPEFKEAMDAYEAFYDEYCDFMQRYSENPTDMTLIAQYGELMARMVDVEAAFEKWDDSDLNDEELKYYLEVNTRVTQKLIDATG